MPGIVRAFTEPFTIGRGMQSTLHVDSGRVSRLHAEVVFEDGEWVLRDAGSTNGTYHNDQRVKRMPLVDGETAVRLGREGPFVYLSVAPLGAEGGAAAVRQVGWKIPGPQRPVSEEDTQRQSQPYRARPTEEPTLWHTVPENSQPGTTRTVPSSGRPEADREEEGLKLPLGKIIVAMVALLMLLLLAALML